MGSVLILVIIVLVVVIIGLLNIINDQKDVIKVYKNGATETAAERWQAVEMAARYKVRMEQYEAQVEQLNEERQLRNCLENFNNETVQGKYPQAQILNQEFVSAFIRYKPTNMSHFRQQFPLHLRSLMNTNEAEFLPEIFEIIEKGCADNVSE